MKLFVRGVPGQHQWPWFWVIAWENTGDDVFDGFAYPRFPPEDRNDDWHTQTFDLTLSPDWTDMITQLVVWPVAYDDQIIGPYPDSSYYHAGGTSGAAPVVSGIIAMMMEKLIQLSPLLQ